MKLQELFTELIEDNTCVNCGNIVDENLRKWFSDKWVNIGKKKKGGGEGCGSNPDSQEGGGKEINPFRGHGFSFKFD